jgi:hypothetical protein
LTSDIQTHFDPIEFNATTPVPFSSIIESFAFFY